MLIILLEFLFFFGMYSGDFDRNGMLIEVIGYNSWEDWFASNTLLLLLEILIFGSYSSYFLV